MFSLVTLCLIASAIASPVEFQLAGQRIQIIPGDDGITNTPLAPTRGRSVNLVPRADVCRNATYEEFQNSPMKDRVLKAASDTWGSNNNRIYTNPDEFSAPPFQYCFKPDNVKEAAYTSTPSCSTQTNELGGTVVNGTADVSIQITQGITSTHEVSVSHTFTTTSTTTVSLEFDIPDMFKVGVSESVAVAGAFTNGDSKTTAINQATTEGVIAHATHPGLCSVKLNVTSCEGTATTSVDGYFKGSVWFSYPKKVNGHWNWALIIDSFIPENERSSPITLNDKVHSTNSGNFISNCS